MKRKETIVFSTTLYEIDRMINNKIVYKLEQEDINNKELVAKALPPQYSNFRDVFSKKDSNVLSLTRDIDHYIILDSE